MELMATGKKWDLAIVDPPYGIGMAKGIEVGKWKRKIHTIKDWDDATPSAEYWEKLFKVSKNQIIWGANYFIEYLKNTRCFIFWDKKNGTNFMSDGELAWTSFDSSVRRYVYNHIQDFNKGIERIHPTQKPIQLYKWLIHNYAQPNQTILDTHGGSMSIAIACWDLGFDLDICELDTDYFNQAVKRFENHIAQTTLF
jgi:site-specific DNA-methyltransferase (adenine-specific)